MLLQHKPLWGLMLRQLKLLQQSNNSTAAPLAQPAVALGQPASMQNYLFDGMGTQQRITTLVDSLTAPFAQTAKSAADAYNAAANFTGTTRSPEDLQLISFLEQSNQITPAAAAQLVVQGALKTLLLEMHGSTIA